MKYLGAIIVLLALVSCTTPTAPKIGTQLTPTDEWRQWYTEVEKCFGVQRPFSPIEFYHVPDHSLDTIADQQGVMGMWWPDRYIYLVDFIVTTNNKTTIQHEMGHYILQSGNHSQQFYKCGLMV